MSRLLEHSDIASSYRSGYASYQSEENRDNPENRARYIEDHMLELVEWLHQGYREVLDEFIESSGQVCRESYESWLN